MKVLIWAIPTLILLLCFLALAAHGQRPTPNPERKQQIQVLRQELQRLAAKGREHVFDTYATWSVTPKLNPYWRRGLRAEPHSDRAAASMDG